MENNVDVLLDKISEHVKEMTQTETIIGDEFQMGEFTCKPVIKVGVGFGSAGGTGEHPKAKGNGKGNAAGAGIGICPVGFLATKGDELTFIPADKSKGISSLFENMPDILDKIMDIKERKETGKTSSNKKEQVK